MSFLYAVLAALCVLVALWLVVPQGWKTRIYGVLVTLTGLLEGLRQMLADSDLAWLTPQAAGGLLLGIGVAILVLRQVTTTPPGQGE
jgi:hypothetical protein